MPHTIETIRGMDKLVAKSRGGMAGCTARLRKLRAKVSAGIHPSKLLLLILTALDITERPLITVAYIAFYLVTGPPALMIESRLVGGQWCTVGTHMPGMKLLCAVIRHPAVQAKLGIHMGRSARRRNGGGHDGPRSVPTTRMTRRSSPWRPAPSRLSSRRLEASKKSNILISSKS